MAINLGKLDVLGKFAALTDDQIIELVIDNAHKFRNLESDYFDVHLHRKAIVLRTAATSDDDTYDLYIRIWEEGVPNGYLEIYHEDTPNLCNWQVTSIDGTYRWADCRDAVHFTTNVRGEADHNYEVIGLLDLRKILCAMLFEIGVTAA